MRAPLLGLAIVAVVAAGCTQDAALGDPAPVRPVASDSGSMPPVGHGGPLDQQAHPATSGSSAGMAGSDAANGTLARPIEPDENTGFAPDVPASAGPAPGDQAARAVDTSAVSDSAGTDRDRTLNQRIRLALAAEDGLSAEATGLSLATVDGVVTVRGDVATAEAKERIETAVRAQEGVKKVQNHLGVATP